MGKGSFPAAVVESATVPGWHGAKWHWDGPASLGPSSACVGQGPPAVAVRSPNAALGAAL